ncbi:MAG: cupin domain-containing protein [Candidatus Hydrogenedentes bacterium]|nr:cupin domain-containing protein [Candidatus Hydrogenedentota bacterium]
MMISPEKFIHTHQVPGEIIVQCLEGRISFTAGETTQELNAGEMLYLTGNVPHSIKGIENASVLLTMLLRKAGDHYPRHD